MTDRELPEIGRRKLPPLGPSSLGDTSTESVTRKKKRKPPQNDQPDDGEAPRRVPPRPRSSHSQADVKENDTTLSAESAGDVPKRTKVRPPSKRTKSKLPETSDAGPSESLDQTNIPPRPKKKKKARLPESQEDLVENDHTANGDVTTDRSGAATKPKRKKKRKPQVGIENEVGLERELRELEEDVVAADSGDDSVDDRQWATPAMRSEPVNKVFIEQRSGFKSANKAKIARKRADAQRRAMEQAEPVQTKNTIQFAISSHKVFRTIVLFFQGLLAGICLWQIVTVYMLSNQSYDILLENYYKLAMPVQAMYYFLFALSTVAVFDRNDIARPTKRFVLRSVTMQSSAIACFFYLAGMVFSLAAARTDDKMGLYMKQPDLWENEQAKKSELKTWVILNLIRGIMPMLGWFVISLRPGSDRLIKNLEKADENVIGDDTLQLDENGAVRSSGV